MNNIISIKNIHKSFGENKILDDVSIEIEENKTLVIIGRSGVGKSVLLKHIIGILKPDSGSINVLGKEVTKLGESELAEMRKNFGMLFQGAALFDSLTVGENVAFALQRHTNYSKNKIEKIVKEKLELVGMEGTEKLKPSELSGGMRKRVGLARAISMDPKIILYDEPTTGIDPIMADAINNLIVDLKKELNITSIAVTHDMVSAYKIADRIAMLYKGKFVDVGTPEQIENSKSPIVKQFITGSAKGPITDKAAKVDG